ncbi:MAG: hypothetical protein ACXWAT_00235 [Methylobacter sp.]
MNTTQQWLDSHPDKSTDYALLAQRLRSGEKVECVINLKSGFELALAQAEFNARAWSELFDLITQKDQDVLRFVGEQDLIEFCAKNKLVFAQKDFLNDTRRLLEIARNAAEFKAVTVPLNTPEDVEALLALMGTDSTNLVGIENGSL